ncbi:ethanolamine ammonia-lyase subunit EutC [Paenisporosarcina antarctica]|uniref:Ethanolamine ammonia-lyase small subunit n=1 Tax=Paenisporosarcina antarctica TaxID=417367 RepID=A0A4P7A1K1_9BACL|nr:ethanolamine ammonia-lyase subunit EutC [Paenisporosarcina antarctica]QBP42563.1 ethanolamine ammonia-lyase subunit EutC [Paenisporosarcina antarctica]
MDIEQIVREVVEQIRKKKNVPQEIILDVPLLEEGLVYSREKVVGVKEPTDSATIAEAQKITPARIGIGRAGTRMRTKSYLDFQLDHAAAQDAVKKEVSEQFLEKLAIPILKTKAQSLSEYLMNLDSGRVLCDESVHWLQQHSEKGKQVQIIISDGLSTTGIEENVPNLLSALEQGLKMKNISMEKPIFIKRSRVWVQDHVASIVNCDLVISLIGERPGLATSKSVSAYLIYKPTKDSVEADRTVISNIHKGGVQPLEAGAYLSDMIADILIKKVSGVKYTQTKE